MAKLLASTTKNAIQKELSAQLLSSAGVGDPISFDDVDGVPNLPGVLVINRVDSSGTATPSKREYIEYSGTSGTTVLITTRNVDGSNAALTHAVGSIVEFIPDVTWADRIYDALANVVDVDTLALDTTKVVDPSTAQTLSGKSIVLGGSNYINASGATISTILDEDTLSSDSDSALATQQSIKAYSDSATQTLTNKTLTSPIITGSGFDAWGDWTPTLTNLSGGTLDYAKYTQIGKIVHWRFKYTLGGAGVSGDVSFTPPVSFNTDYSQSGVEQVGFGSLRDAGTAVYFAHCFWVTDGKINIKVSNSASTSYLTITTSLSSTVPFTWASGDQIIVSGTYEAA